MKKLIIALLACVLGATAAQAQKTKAEISAEITTLFPDNTVGAITPLGLRTVALDTVNSIMPTAPVVSGNLACFNGTTGLLQDCGVAPSGIYTALSGDCTATLLAVITCTKTNGVAFSALATTVPGTGVAAALGVNIGSAGAPVLFNGALGAPSSGSLANTTGYALANLTGAGAGVLTWAATPSSANLRAALTDETGTGLAYFQGGDIGTPSAGVGSNLTGLNATQLGTGTVPPGRTNGHQNGTATNDNAAAGEIGEYTECALAQGSATSLTTNTAKDVCTVSLTAGDWDVSGAIGFLPGASTSITVLYGGWSTVANTADTTAGKYFQQATAAQIPTNIVQEFAVPTYRFSLSGTTTVRLIGLSIFTASTNTAFGLIRARRVR